MATQYVSEWDRSVRGRPKYDAEGTFAYGRVEYFLVLDGEVITELIGRDKPHDRYAIDGHEALALAVISPIPSFKRLKDCNLITYALVGDRLGPVEVVDVEDVVCLVGRVQDNTGSWFVVDRTSVVGRMDFVDSLIDPN